MPPEYVAKYDSAFPGSADRIIRMAEDEAKHGPRNPRAYTKDLYDHFYEACVGQGTSVYAVN